MVKHTLKILQQILQDFLNVFDHFDTLCVNSLNQRLLGLSSFPSPVIWTRTPIFNTSIKYQFILLETFRWLLLGKNLTNWHKILRSYWTINQKKKYLSSSLLRLIPCAIVRPTQLIGFIEIPSKRRNRHKDKKGVERGTVWIRLYVLFAFSLNFRIQTNFV